MSLEEKIKAIEKRIFDHQKEHGFETIFDLIGEDLVGLKIDQPKEKTNTGQQTKMFHQWLNETYTWMDNDIKAISRKAWFASVRFNKKTKKP